MVIIPHGGLRTQRRHITRQTKQNGHHPTRWAQNREPKEDKDKVILPGTCIPEKYEVSKPKSSSVTSIKRFHKTIGRDNVRRV